MPRSPSPSADSVALRLIGSTLCSTSVSVWNSVLTSSCTDDGLHRARRAAATSPDGASGGRNSTDLAPKTVVPPMRTVALDGM